MIKQFSIMSLDGRGGWEPSTLIVDSTSGRPETLAFSVTSTRGRGSLLFKGVVWAERRDPAMLIVGASRLHGYEIVRFEMDEPHPGARQIYGFATVVADEILRGMKDMRRTKPVVPVSKHTKDEFWTCVACGIKTMSRGSDNTGWKGVQMRPADAVLVYFCAKSACRGEFDKAVETAKVNWGYEDTTGAPPEPAEPAELPPMPWR